MNYSETWFGQHPISIHACGGFYNGRTYWLHQTVEIFTGNIVSMYRKNPDGSSDVLGAEFLRLRPGFITGSRNRENLQRSIEDHATVLSKAGALIVKQTKNTLVALYGKERLKMVISACKTLKD